MLTSTVATALAGLGSAVTGGLYAVFSARVMPHLAALPPGDGMARMQELNRQVEQAPFLTAFFGTAAASGVVLWRTLRDADRTAPDLVAAAGAGLSLVGFLVTIGYNVPRNQALASADAHAPSSGPLWQAYLDEWGRANTARAWGTLLAAALLLTAAALMARRAAAAAG